MNSQTKEGFIEMDESGLSVKLYLYSTQQWSVKCFTVSIKHYKMLKTEDEETMIKTKE